MRVAPVSQKTPTELNQLLESNTRGLLEHKLGDVPGLEDWGVLFEGALRKVAWVHPHFYCHVWALWPSFRHQQWPTVWLFSTAWWELSLCSPLDKAEEIVPGDFSACSACRHGSANWSWTFKSMSYAENSKRCFPLLRMTTKEMELKLDCRLWRLW